MSERTSRRDIRQLLVEGAEQAGAPDAIGLALQLELLFHGAPVVVSAESARDVTVAVRTAAAALLRAALEHQDASRSTTKAEEER